MFVKLRDRISIAYTCMTEKKCNEDILKETSAQRELVTNIRKRISHSLNTWQKLEKNCNMKVTVKLKVWGKERQGETKRDDVG